MFTFNKIRYYDILDIQELWIRPGLTALLGKSGGGKTTLLRMLNKMISPTEGQISYRGKLLKDIPSVEHRRRVLMLSQNPVMFPGTIGENLAVGFRFQDKEPPATEHLSRVLHQVGLYKEMEDAAELLSGGERQRLALARVMLLEPEVLLLDEPSAALDDLSEDLMMGMVSTYIRQQGKSAVLVTHSRQVAEKYAGDMIEVQSGRIAEVQRREGPHDATVQ